jgi:hypothetical protein
LAAAVESLETRRMLTTYYVDADAASGGDGLSPATAWNSLATVNAAPLLPDDQVLFQRGDTWRGTLAPTRSGTAGHNILFGAYGTGAKPRILGSNVITSGWTQTAGFTNVWEVSLPSVSRMVTIGETGLVRESTGQLANLGPGEFLYASSPAKIWIYSATDPSTLGVEAAQRTNSVYAGTNHDFITVQDLAVGRNNGSGILVNANSDNWLVQRCDVRFTNATGASDNNPCAGITPGPNTRVLDNTVSFFVGDGIYVQSAKDVEVSRNLIYEQYTFNQNFVGDGIQVTGAAPDRFKVTGNDIDIFGSDTGKGCIMTEFGADGLIADNRVRGGMFGIEVNGDRNVVERNVVHDATANGGIRSANSNNADGIVIRNNLVYDIGSSGLFLTDDTGVTDKVRSNLRIYNNTFVNTGGVTLSNMAVSGEFRNNIVKGNGGDYLLNIGKFIPGQQFVSSNNVYEEQNANSKKLVRLGAAESSISLTPGKAITVNGVSTGVTAATNTGYDVLLRIDYAAAGNTVNAWVNPNFALGEAGLGAPQAVSVTSSNWGIRSVSTSYSSDTFNEGGFDNIRLGNTLADATGTGTPTAEETFNSYAANQLVDGLNGGTGWGGAWQASNIFSKITTGLSMTTKGDTKRALAAKITKTSGSSWVLVRMSGQSSSRTSTFQLHDDLGAQYFNIAEAQANGIEIGSQQGDPGFVNAAASDYHITATSIARNAGLTLAGVTVDFENDARDALTDVGADEYVPPPLYVYEDFNYTTGTISGDNGGTGFSNAWGINAGGGTATVTAGSLAYASGANSLATNGNKFQLYDVNDSASQTASRTFSQTFGTGATATGSVWLAFLANKTSTSRSGTISFGGGLVFQCNNGSNWQVKTDDTAYVATTAGTQAAQHLFVARVDFTAGTDTVRVWIDPALGTTPTDASADVTIADATGLTLSGVTLSHGPFGNSAQRLDFDELRIGSTYGTVTPVAGASRPTPTAPRTRSSALRMSTVGFSTERLSDTVLDPEPWAAL